MILLCLAHCFLPISCPNNEKTDSKVFFKLSPFVIDIDSIIDVYVQSVGSCHQQYRLLGGLHDQLHVFKTSHVEPCTPRLCTNIIRVLCQSLQVGRSWCSVMLLWFTSTLQLHTVIDFLWELTLHNPLGTWTQHFQSQRLVDHLDIQPQEALLLRTDQVSIREWPLATHSLTHLKNSPRRTWHLQPISHHSFFSLGNTKNNLLDPLWAFQNQCTLVHHQQS